MDTDARPPSDGIPPIEQIFSRKCPTRDHVPKEARRLWAQCSTQSLAEIVEHNDEAAWAQFFMLSKCVLRSGQRGGRRKSKNAGAQTQVLCRCWLEGQRQVLWNQTQQTKRKRKARAEDHKLPAEAIDRVLDLVSQGQFSKASSLLVNKPPVVVTDAVV